jgi:hypothetical protein
MRQQEDVPSLVSAIHDMNGHRNVSAKKANTLQAAFGVYSIDPLSDPRWEQFVDLHPRGRIFHTTGWLESLRRTYGYRPVAFTTSRPSEGLENALLFCRISSPLTGSRLVALPFSDHCDALVGTPSELRTLFAAAEQELRKNGLNYVEMRPLHSLDISTPLYQWKHEYRYHEIDLSPDLDTLFQNCHRDSIQRKVRRAEREDLTCRIGNSESLLRDFYRLFLLTRRRHQLPPQSLQWFRNLIDCMGQSLSLRVAFKSGQPIAAIATLCYKDTMVYKYGCSDVRFNNLGGTHLLIWSCIQEAKQKGLTKFDLGRSDCENAGLITFKDRWGAAQSTLAYSRYASSTRELVHLIEAKSDWRVRVAKRIMEHTPDFLLSFAGSVLYKHVG